MKENVDRCVCCGDIIPEGRQVCPKCEKYPSDYKKAGHIEWLWYFIKYKILRGRLR